MAYSALSNSLLDTLFIEDANANPISIKTLREALDPSQATVLTPQDTNFDKYQIAFNKRTLQTPMVRVLCKNNDAIIKTLDWAQQNNVPIASRCGGHSYEGLSQTKGIVIDTRPMNSIYLSTDNESVNVGGGASLGSIYMNIGNKQLAIAAGSCPTVGVTGHTLGGGYGLLSRPFGLACDNVLEFEMITADRKILKISAKENQDLNWALRGGGGGSFGVITQMKIKTHKVPQVLFFGYGWSLDANKALKMMKTWQTLAPQMPKEITSIFKISKDKTGNFSARVIGQSIGSEANLKKALQNFISISSPTKSYIKAGSFIDGFKNFSGGSVDYPAVYMKAKSDYLTQVMSDQGLKVFLTQIPLGIAVMFDCYGGAINNFKNTETAFAHRENTLCSMQYYREWQSSADSDKNILLMRKFYDLMRPYVSGNAYVNYCDLDLKNYSKAYWGNNLSQLVQIKQKYDPRNVFSHAQSIPVKL